jgi:trans-aconitate methyltransferase
MTQDDVFARGEGDQWFERNRAALDGFDAERDLPLKVVQLYGLAPRSVIEVGASNGARLGALVQRYGARAVGVEVSAKAVADGKARYPAVDFVRASAADVRLSEQFDLVIVNFVFHWIDRERLMQSIAAVDALVADGGHLLIGDFQPSNFTRTHYHHRADVEVWTYKQSYAASFLASGLYHAVCMLSTNHGSTSLTADVDEANRSSVWLLRKALHAHYVVSALTPTSR